MKSLNEKENRSPILVGLSVDYLTRISLGDPIEEALSVPMKGFEVAEIYGVKGSIKAGTKLLKGIKGTDDNSIVNMCKLVSFDIWSRNPEAAVLSQNYKDINPNSITVSNISTLVNRSLSFFSHYGPITKFGFTFEEEGQDRLLYDIFRESGEPSFGGYTKTVDSGDGDFLTIDTLWDLKVSVSKPKPKHTLQILMYWIMGQHSGQHIFRSINKIGIFNPRLNSAFVLNIDSISQEIIHTIEKEVICY